MTYSGWKNYETWAVNLWIDNDAGSYGEIGDLTERSYSVHDLAARMKHLFLAESPLVDQSNVYSDLLNAAMSEVDWLELAEHYWQDFREEEEVEE